MGLLLIPPYAMLAGSGLAAFGGGELPEPYDPSPFGLDALTSKWGIYSPAYRVLTSYAASGNLVRLRRSSDDAESDFAAVRTTGLLDTTAVASWLGADTAYVTTVYDQSGNGYDIAQPTASLQPTLNLGGSIPFVSFANTSGCRLIGTSGLGFSRNQPHFSCFTVVRYNNTTQTSGGMSVQSGVNTNRMAFQKTASVFRASSRRLDADGSSTVTTGFAASTNWVAQIGGFDFAGGNIYHRVDANTETVAMSGTPGNTSDTDASPEHTFNGQYFNNFRNSDFTLWGLSRDLLDTTPAGVLATALAALKVT